MALEVMNLIMRTEMPQGGGAPAGDSEKEEKEEKKTDPCVSTYNPGAETPSVKKVVDEIRYAFENRNER